MTSFVVGFRFDFGFNGTAMRFDVVTAGAVCGTGRVNSRTAFRFHASEMGRSNLRSIDDVVGAELGVGNVSSTFTHSACERIRSSHSGGSSISDI